MILDIIGTVVSGSHSKYLLQTAIPIREINEAKNHTCIRVPKSQISCILDLIQIIRKILENEESKAAQMTVKYFKHVIKHLDLNNQTYVKQIYAILVVLSNSLFVFLRPNTLVETKDKNSYYILSIDETNQQFEGLQIPVSHKIIRKKVNFSEIIKLHEPIELNKSQIIVNNVLIPLLKKVINLKTSNCSVVNSLLFFYMFKNIEERINDLQNNEEFHDLFISFIKTKDLNDLKFGNQYSQTILELIEKSLTMENNGIFSSNSSEIQMHHVSFTEIVFNNSFVLTNDKLQAIDTPHVFISSILKDDKPSYFSLNYENAQQAFSFGLIVHSINGRILTILYSSKKSQFIVNDENIFEYKLISDSLMECCYSPINNTVTFADSKNSSVILACNLGIKSKCSFIISVHPETKINYKFDSFPQTNCFKNNKNNINKSISLNHGCENETIDISSLTSLEFDNLLQTRFSLDDYINAYSSPYLKSILSSPINLKRYPQIQSASGEFDLVDSDKTLIEHVNSIPSFNWTNYHYLPPEIINYYIKEACKNHNEEIFMFLSAHLIAKTTNISLTMNNLFKSMLVVVNFLTSALFLLEPIYISNLNEEKSPIDFISVNSLEKCHKTDLYDYFTAVKRIIDQFKKDKKNQLIQEWFKKLKSDFSNKFSHFCSQDNKNLLIVKSSIVKEKQLFNVENALGWLIFPYKFKCYRMPSITDDGLIFPKKGDDKVNYAYCKSEILKIKANYNIESSKSLITFGILPLFNNPNDTLFNSFYYLAVSFKYFVLFSKDNLDDKTKQIIWKMFIDSIIAGSPFFYSHSFEFATFLNDQIDLLQEQMSLLDVLNDFNISIKLFINMKKFIFNIEKAKEFEKEIFSDKAINEKIQFPENIVPKTLTPTTPLEPLLKVISQILIKDDKDFPIHLILTEWIESFIRFPPCIIKIVSPKVLSIEFTVFTPVHSFCLYSDKYDYNTQVHVSTTNDSNSVLTGCQMGTIYTKVNSYEYTSSKRTYYITFSEDITKCNFFVYNYFFSDKSILSQLIYKSKSLLMNDIQILCNSYTIEDNQQLLKLTNYNDYLSPSMQTRLSIYKFTNLNNSKPMHLNYLRGIYLISLNYILMNAISIDDFKENKKIKRFLYVDLFATNFMKVVDSKSLNSYDTLKINREKALNYRNGVNKNEEDSMIAQFTKYYFLNPSNFRNIHTPFKISYSNEIGVDAGGLMRDFITEIVNDINTPNIGLFIQTPNGRNREGLNQESIIPNPSPEIKNSTNYYHAIGAFLAILIRANLKQVDLHFPPLFWEFIVDGKLTIDDIYSIDNSYHKITSDILIESTKMTNEKFETMMCSLSLLNARGIEIKLDHLDRITKSNCEEMIERCNEIRINELKKPLSEIRSGFWENLNFIPPSYITASLIEFLVCNEKILTIDELKKDITFNDVPEIQQKFFWEAVSKMDNDELKKLIYFSTGLNSIGTRRLIVNAFVCEVDSHLPSASTCLFTLNLPPFSSSDKMYSSLKIAINEGTTFEKS